MEFLSPDLTFCVSVVGVDTLSKRNFSGKSIPKYNNIVKNSMFDEDTGIYIPQSAIKEAPYTGKNPFNLSHDM